MRNFERTITLLSGLLLCLIPTLVFAQSPGDVVINEVDADTPSIDELEFIELYDGGSGNTALDGLVVVLYNGLNDLSYRAMDLDGFSTNVSGFFLLGNSGVPGVDLTFPNNTLQQGADAVALYFGDASDFPNGTAVTTTNLIDAIVYDTDDADDSGLLVLLNSGQPQVNENSNGNSTTESSQRIPNGSGGARNTDTYIQILPTPKAVNSEHCFSVTNTNDAGLGCLRQAILNANAVTNLDASTPDTIKFDIPTSDPGYNGSYWTISPTSDLDPITEAVIIDGYTQSGATPATVSTDATILVALDGSFSITNGLHITGGSGTTIKGLAIYGFVVGILIDELSSANSVEGNFIGTDPTGTVAIGNGNGVQISLSPGNTIGGTTPASRNIIAASIISIPDFEGVGILINSSGNTVQGNYIGTDVTGTIVNPTGDFLEGGEFTNSGGISVSGSDNLIGGTAPGAGNLISGNIVGVFVSDFGNRVQGNLIGTDASGTITDPDGTPGTGDELGNLSIGVWIEGLENVIGGANPGAGNVIAGNGFLRPDVIPIGSGVLINREIEDIDEPGHLVQGNFIGTDATGSLPLPNFLYGIYMVGSASNNTIGGAGSGEGNIIAYNDEIGVFLEGGPRNRILGNAIFNNGALSIDLAPIGVNTPNDDMDPDTGPNNLQNFPDITSATTTGSSITITGTFNSTPDTDNFRLEFFANTVCNGDQNGVAQTDDYGEGETFLGFTTVNTDVTTGNASFSVILSATVPAGAFITATATDLNDNTSEFSQCVETVAAGKAFVLLAEEDIEINGHNFSEGDIHANSDIDFYDGDPSSHTGNLTAVDDIRIDEDNTINGDITAGDNADVDHDATVTGTVTEHTTVAKIPLPTLSFTAGGDDITVEELQTLSLPPGLYDDVEVEKGATLILSHNGTTGEYFLDKLLIGKKAFLSIDASLGEVIINVVDELEFDRRSEVIITSPAGDSRFVTFNSLDGVTIEEDARVLGNIIVPEHKVKIEEGAVFKGAICAENIEIEENVTFVHHSSTTPLPKSVAPELTDEDDEVSSDENIVDSFALEQNYPNPFNPTTVIRYQLPATSDVKLSIYNMTGQLVKTLVNGEMPAGQHSVTWNATDDNGARVATGVYLYVIRAGDPSSGSEQGFVSQRKLILMK